ncbi:hypothetical protein [Methanobrevibacter filiformis]|uniref:Uncharacterized protein n=1 Tax=Methanobrevibacter filiformis TaxID=55758 RepID=A0A166FF97_9EURY|nr:hypothetical protein [Methanobrevibacter filiformis]KZX17616.1 hypothetical protein MBFIL_00450 [Methanobrevibacter filiformis]
MEIIKKLSIDNKGNIFAIGSILLIIPIILIAIMILNLSIDSSQINTNSIASNSFNYEIEDYRRNIGIIGYETIENLSEEAIETKIAISDSREEIKKKLQEKLDEKSNQYYNNSNTQIKASVLYVDNNEDPFHITIKTELSGVKDNQEYQEIIENNISIIGLKDPLPPLICGNDSNFTIDENGKYNYGNSLFNYLNAKNTTNPQEYINATSPATIKPCPYDPYIQHGVGVTMKNCVDNGYYHESADGSCYLCRLEGKGYCYHYGMETFIIVNKSSSNTLIKSTSASDHVIFGYDSYPGESIVFYREENSLNNIIILDDSHKAKYGLG